jgi:hypothetical protein
MSPMLHVTHPGGGFTSIQRPSLAQELQPALVRAQQQRDEVDVLVRRGAHVPAPLAQRRLRLRVRHRRGHERRVVDHAQNAVALVHLVREERARLPEVHRERLQDASAQRVQLLEHRARRFREVALLDAHVGGHLRFEPVAGRQVPAEVPELLQVVAWSSPSRSPRRSAV